MPRLLKDLQINDVSSVDRGAGEGVRVLLVKRDFTQKERDKAADTGAAMKDGSFPIENEADLHNAIRAIGRAKDPAAAKAHIKTRAKSMGMESALPEDWTKRHLDPNVIDMTGLLKAGVKKDAIDFDEASDMQESREVVGDFMQEVQEAICALNDSVCSIMCDESTVDKATAVNESFEQFKAHLEGLAPEDMEKAMTPAEIKKQIDDAVAAVTNPLVAKVAALEEENAFLKLSPAEQDYCKAKEMTAEEKKKFAAKEKGDKEKEMEDAKKAAASKIDPEIQKRLAKADADSILLKQLVEKDEIATFAKKAVDLGLNADQGEVLRKASKGGDLSGVEGLIKQLTSSLDATQRTGKIFAEFGKAGGNQTGVSAYDELVAKAEEFRKTEAGSKLTQAQAFDRVMSDPANAALAKREKDERLAKINGRHAA